MNHLSNLLFAGACGAMMCIALIGCCRGPQTGYSIALSGHGSDGAHPHIELHEVEPGQIGTLRVGENAIVYQVSAPPSYSFRVEEAGEFQIDGLGTLDPILQISRDGEVLLTDDDGGEGNNARITAFLEQGTYTVSVTDSQNRPMVAQLQARRLPPLETVGAISTGQPATVRVPAGASTRATLRSLSLAIGQADLYQLDAVGSAGRDAELAVLRDGNEIHRDSDSGDGLNARVRCQLEPGQYELRVWEYGNNEATIQVSVERTAVVAARPQPRVEQVGALSIAQPMSVEIPATSDTISGTRAFALNIPEAGLYQVEAMGPQGVDAEIALFMNGQELQRDSDSGDGLNAMLNRELAQGQYELRVWEYQNRGGRITVAVNRP